MRNNKRHQWFNDGGGFTKCHKCGLKTPTWGKDQSEYYRLMYEDCPADGSKPATAPVPAPSCSVAIRVASDVLDRSAKGTVKYGVTLDRTDLSRKEWLQHLYEEQLDAACYTRKLMDMEND